MSSSSYSSSCCSLSLSGCFADRISTVEIRRLSSSLSLCLLARIQTTSRVCERESYRDTESGPRRGDEEKAEDPVIIIIIKPVFVQFLRGFGESSMSFPNRCWDAKSALLGFLLSSPVDNNSTNSRTTFLTLTHSSRGREE